MDFQSIRKEYESRGADFSDLSSDPLTALRQWLAEATENSPGRWFEPNAMALATTDKAGRVTVRWVLLKGITADGIRFFTNYDSKKARQLADNPRAAVALHWPYLGRQIRIEGAVEKTSREVSEEYFHSRPRGSQLGAVVSPQSAVIESREQLDDARSRLDEEMKDQPVPLPENWGGYLIRPDRFEFWQGRLDRLHDRIVYQKDDSDAWKTKRLAP